ncbi:hypothetical protein [uncultured Sphingomonas sp.]|uniref:hypothetical protein n=1 Tax=uncultured Sphingomonas sp. TaxID=158754 RepID=UPI00261884C5|nr:hypothetical protein [uncultured Sphingomonas sp.]
MNDTPDTPIDDAALDSISVAPPAPSASDTGPAGADSDDKPEVREAHDASDHAALAKDPSHEDAKLDVGLDESYPSSDPPANVAPGHDEPAPSSGFDEAAEKAREAEGR